MSRGSEWGVRVARAEFEAQRRYSGQPERARHYIDNQLDLYGGPYKLEPLTFVQKIEAMFGVDHETDYIDGDEAARQMLQRSETPPWWQFWKKR